MTDAQSVTIAVTLFAISGAMLYNRKSVEGMRDVLRGGSEDWHGGDQSRVKSRDYADVQASHSERLDRLDGEN